MPRGNSRPPAHVPWRRPQAIPPRAPDLSLPAGVSSSRPPSCGTSGCQTRAKSGLFSLRDADAEGRRAGVSHESDGPRAVNAEERAPALYSAPALRASPASACAADDARKSTSPNRAIARLRMLQASTLGLLRSDRHAGDCPRPPPAVIPERAHDLCHRGLEGGRTVGDVPVTSAAWSAQPNAFWTNGVACGQVPLSQSPNSPFRSWLNPTRSVVPLSIEK
jgi:hypothetical protein